MAIAHGAAPIRGSSRRRWERWVHACRRRILARRGPAVQLLSLVVGIIVSLWILRHGQFSGDAAVTPTPAERPAPAMAADEITPDGAGRDDGPQIGPALPAPPPYLVYLVRDDQQQRAMGGSAPADGVATLVAGAPEALAAALAQVRLLEANLAIGQSARAVQVIDGRE